MRMDQETKYQKLTAFQFGYSIIRLISWVFNKEKLKSVECLTNY